MIEKAHIGEELLVCNNKGEIKKYRNGAYEKASIIGEVEVIRTSWNGQETLFTRTIHHNDLLVNGAVFMSEKNNNMRSSFAPTPLDVDLGVHQLSDVDRTDVTVPLERVCGLVVGVEGCTNTYNTVRPVYRHHRTVPGIVPYRTVQLDVTGDLSNQMQSKYFLRVEKMVQGQRCAVYYGKRFEKTQEIKVMFEDDTDVPTDVHILTDPKFIKVYTEHKVTIDQSDIREWFKLMEGSTVSSRVNSVGLVAGYPVKTFSADGQVDDNGNPMEDIWDYYNVRTLTTMNMENQELKDSASTITFIYRLLIL